MLIIFCEFRAKNNGIHCKRRLSICERFYNCLIKLLIEERVFLRQNVNIIKIFILFCTPNIRPAITIWYQRVAEVEST